MEKSWNVKEFVWNLQQQIQNLAIKVDMNLGRKDALFATFSLFLKVIDAPAVIVCLGESQNWQMPETN
ncbi:MAG: hypothetical protein R3237_01015 [Nitrosopumilaceae archaeon]|nr:hypothetical protein [Nitrosopumilaceae archaeon]